MRTKTIQQNLVSIIDTDVAVQHGLRRIQLDQLPHATDAARSVEGVVAADGPVDVSRSRPNVQGEGEAPVPPNVVEPIDEAGRNFLSEVVVIDCVGGRRG